jgi:hypothetical protein
VIATFSSVDGPAARSECHPVAQRGRVSSCAQSAEADCSTASQDANGGSLGFHANVKAMSLQSRRPQCSALDRVPLANVQDCLIRAAGPRALWVNPERRMRCKVDVVSNKGTVVTHPCAAFDDEGRYGDGDPNGPRSGAVAYERDGTRLPKHEARGTQARPRYARPRRDLESGLGVVADGAFAFLKRAGHPVLALPATRCTVHSTHHPHCARSSQMATPRCIPTSAKQQRVRLRRPAPAHD